MSSCVQKSCDQFPAAFSCEDRCWSLGVYGNLGLEQREKRREGSGAVSVQCHDADMPCHTTEFPISAEKENVTDLRFLVAWFGFH